MQVCDFTKSLDMSFAKICTTVKQCPDIGTISSITFSSRSGYVVDPNNIVTFIGYGKKVLHAKKESTDVDRKYLRDDVTTHAIDNEELKDYIGICRGSFDQTEPVRGILNAWKIAYPHSRIIVPRGTLCKHNFIGENIHEHDWVWTNVIEKKQTVCTKDIMHKSRPGDILVVSNPLCVWGTKLCNKDLERIGMAVYTKGLFVLCDERMWRLSSMNGTVLPSVSSCCPERSVVIDEVYANGTRICVASVGKHKLMGVIFNHLLSTIHKIPSFDTICAASHMYSVEHANRTINNLCAAIKVIRVLKMFVCKYLGRQFTKICTDGCGPCVLVPFPFSKVKKTNELGVIVKSLEEYGMGGYIPLFLTDLDMPTAVNAMETNTMNINYEHVDEWVKQYAPNIYAGVKTLCLILSDN